MVSWTESGGQGVFQVVYMFVGALWVGACSTAERVHRMADGEWPLDTELSCEYLE